jgi:methylmalonyl-CoA mutase cobalamin-binding domain/chain
MKGQESFKTLEQSIIENDERAAKNAILNILKEGVEPAEILSKIVSISTAMGDKFENGEIFLPELMMMADTLKAASDSLMAEMSKRNKTIEGKMGKVVIATVTGDIHDIGKNITAFLLSASGFEIYDMGRDVPTMEIIKKANEIKADIIALSALMTTSMPYQKEVLDNLRELSERDKFEVMVGGAPPRNGQMRLALTVGPRPLQRASRWRWS